MAAPTWSSVPAGATDATGDWSYTGGTSAGATTVILHILQDGATGGAVALTGSSNVNNLAGSAGWTSIGAFTVGGSSEAIQHLWIGRKITPGTDITASGTNSTSEDLYIRFYEFANVSAGTTLATVIENGTAGATTNSTGSSATIADASVTTLGVDRLAVNFIAVNDDNVVGHLIGGTGGNWNRIGGAIPYYAESSGTDGCIDLQNGAMATAGTIDGGTASIVDIDAWGIVGFALIGTTVETARVPFTPRYPQHLAQ